jgi:N-acetylglucosaminyl-diphospho-decaprenol L-rhamnosyltransferase
MRSFDVAVVIVTYRTAQLTISCLRSLQEERQASKELSVRAIVVDNASGDAAVIRAAQEAESWQSWVTVIESSVNGGFAYGNNLGVRQAYAEKTPDYVYLLNPDTEVRPGAIRALIRFLEASPRVGIAGGSFEHLDGRIWPISFRFPTIYSELSHGLEIGVVSRLLQRWTVAWPMTQLTQPTDWICGAAMMIRPAVFDRIGGFDENYFLYFEETDFCNRARQAGYATWYVPESRVMHIMGQSTKVTDEKVTLQRFPAYWFQSRSRYFAVTFGVVHAMVIDLVAVLASCLGLTKRLALRRPSVPYYIRDLIRYSVLRPRNRAFPAVRGVRPGA